LFLDRDGIINHDIGYTHKIPEFKFIDGIFDLCRVAVREGYILIVVTNQAGIGRGLYTETDFLRLTDWMRGVFELERAPITDVFFCPYHPEHGIGEYKADSFDRKPNPGMFLKAAEKHSISLADSIMIGDKDSDMDAAFRAGVGRRLMMRTENDGAGHSGYSTDIVRSLDEARELIFKPKQDAATPEAVI
jgi:D-glycero-D-manno-heptose 1,7-bisphosphate phosphatase